jgi:hypothetical protein
MIIVQDTTNCEPDEYRPGWICDFAIFGSFWIGMSPIMLFNEKEILKKSRYNLKTIEFWK